MAQRPAIVLITADELRKDALGCYGGRAVATPNIDALAERALCFEHAYAPSPWCMPSRCAILTGRYPHNHGAYSNFRSNRLSPESPNLYNLLRQSGYCTSHVGKCHYAPVPYARTRPTETLTYDEFRDYYLSLGLDHLDLQDDKQVSVWFSDDYSRELAAAGHLEAYRARVWDPTNQKVFTFPGPAEWHPDAWVGRKAAEWIRAYADLRPLFLWVSFSGPHFPFDPPEAYLERVDDSLVGQGAARNGEFDDPSRIHHRSFHGGGGIEGAGSAPGRACKNYPDAYWHDLRKAYFANVALIDEQVGRVLAAVADTFGGDAAVIFSADHGEMLGQHRLWGKNACAYEDVLNVPLLVRLPEVAPRRESAQVALIDLLPTCLRLARAAVPAVDGRDLLELVGHGGRRYVFSEGEGFVAVSDGDCKYVRRMTSEGAFTEVFDLVEDPGEFVNVAGEPRYAARRADLEQAVLDLWMGRLLP